MRNHPPTHHGVVKHFGIFITLLIVSLLIVAPIAYDIGGFHSSLLPIILTFIYVYTLCNRKQYVIAFILGISIGIFVSMIIYVLTLFTTIYTIKFYNVFFTAFTITAVFGVLVASTLLNFPAWRKTRNENRHKIYKYLLFATFILLIIYIICSILPIDQNYYIRAISLGMLFGLIFGFGLCMTVNNILLPEVMVYENLLKYLKSMLLPIGAFFLGYLLLIIIFAGFYSFCYHANPQAFSGVSNDSFGEFIYLSINIITTLGDAIMRPAQPLTKSIAGVEVILGMMWVTVILAAAISHFTNEIKKIGKE